MACLTRAVRNCIKYKSIDILEKGYGISLRLLERYAKDKYPELSRKEALLLYISILVLKCEGKLIMNHPEYHMNEQLKLNKIINKTIIIDNKTYYLDYITEEDCSFELTEDEKKVICQLKNDFLESDRLHKHVQFLYKFGSMYLCCNNTLLYHGCIPFESNGHFAKMKFEEKIYSGKALLDYFDKQVREAYFQKKEYAIDLMFYLWSGYHSPLSGRKLKSFERFFINDSTLWIEARNPYYELYNQEDICNQIMTEFNMNIKTTHIVNGHTPVKRNESPIRSNGKVIIIDGGFCKNYQRETGIAGYTLISNSHGLRLKAHTPFKGVERVLNINSDIHSSSQDI